MHLVFTFLLESWARIYTVIQLLWLNVMDTKRLKIDGEEEENREAETVFEDRMSDLPDSIIHLILAYPPTVVALRMSILSKWWRHMWTSIPMLDFNDSREGRYFRGPDCERNNERKKFFKFVDECLRHLYAGKTITKFKLEINGFLWRGLAHR